MENNISISIIKDHDQNMNYQKYVQPSNENIFEIVNNALYSLNQKWHEESILDIGCNVGNLLMNAENKINSLNYVGIDVQEFPLSIAKINFPEYTFKKCGDYNRLFNNEVNDRDKMEDFLSNKQFKTIICRGVFQHLDIQEIKNIFRIVKNTLTDDGIFVFSYWLPSRIDFFVNFLRNKLKIEVSDAILNTEYKDQIYMINRTNLVYDHEKIDSFENLKWLECFYTDELLAAECGNYSKINVENAIHDYGIIKKHEIY